MTTHAAPYLAGELLAFLRDHGYQDDYERFLAEVTDQDRPGVMRGLKGQPAIEPAAPSYLQHPGRTEFAEMVRQMQRAGCPCGQAHDTPLARVLDEQTGVAS